MTIERIVACTDFSENARIAFRAAVEMAARYQAELHIVHVLPPAISPVLSHSDWVYPPEPEEELVSQVRANLQEACKAHIPATVAHRFIVLTGHVSTQIIAYLKAQAIDVVILGAFGLSGMGLVLFGSVAKRISHKAPCSVMIVRQADSIEDE